jgi:serine/threonine protein kinase
MEEIEGLLFAFVRGELDSVGIRLVEEAMDRDPALRRTVGDLVRLEEVTRARGAPDAPPAVKMGVELGPAIGRGGMAIVRSGRQLVLRRDVAIKSPLSGERGAETHLLREALITGALEHPNIVPIHDLYFDEEGTPHLILKRIEGEPWSALMGDHAAIEDRFDRDPIEWNISVTIAVAHALEFAHSRGVVHCDIKPSNVMIGRFNEVYLLDWGLAGSLDPDEHLLPAIAGSRRSGTPAYMAPEQWVGDRDALGTWTDVYLLAGALFHALTGAPPWIVREEVRERRSLPSSFPADLRAVMMEALATDVGERTVDARALRERLETYIRRRGSRVLTRTARERAQMVERAQREGDVAGAEQAALEAAFAFRAALEQWPENETAAEGELELARSRIAAALARGETRVAQRLLASLPDPPPDLVALVSEAGAEAAAEESRSRAIRADVDRFVDVGLRRKLLFATGPLWLAGWSYVAVANDLVVAELWLLAFLGVATPLVLLVARQLFTNRLNRALLLFVFSACIAAEAILLVADSMNLGLGPALAFVMVVWALGVAVGAAAVDLRALGVAVGWLALAALGEAWPQLAGWFNVAGQAVTVWAFLLVNLSVERAGRASKGND